MTAVESITDEVDGTELVSGLGLALLLLAGFQQAPVCECVSV